MAQRFTGEFMAVDYSCETGEIGRLLAGLGYGTSSAGTAAFLATTVAPYLRGRAERRFENEGDDVVGKWQELSAATQEWRENGGFVPDHPINRRTGELEEYIVGAPVGVFMTPGGASLTYPKDPPTNRGLQRKMETAQKGRGYPRTPARPVIGMNEADLAFMTTGLTLYLQGYTANSSRRIRSSGLWYAKGQVTRSVKL